MTSETGSFISTGLSDDRSIERECQAAVRQERVRLAREIHDTLAQAFIGIAIQIEAAEEVLGSDFEQATCHLQRARKLALDSLVEARRTVQGLRSPVLDGCDLPTAFDLSVQQIREGTTLSARFELEGERTPLSSEVEAELLRVGQEALTNIIKHAEATHIRVRLTFTPDELQLYIEDDGRGFPIGQHINHSGYGLLGMRERIERIHGQIEFHSGPAQGTQVVVTVPLPCVSSTSCEEPDTAMLWEQPGTRHAHFDPILRGEE